MNTNLIQYRDVLYIILILVLGSLWLRQCDKNKTTQESLINLNDSIRVLTHRDGTKTFSTGVIETDTKTFKKINTDQPGIAALQKTIDNRTKSATFLGTTTNIIGTFKDSSYVNTPWMSGYISKFNTDSVSLDLNFESDFIVSIREKGFFKKKLEVDVLSINPYTEIGVLKTYVKAAPRSHFGVGPQIGFGVNSELKPNVYVGFGIQYNIFTF